MRFLTSRRQFLPVISLIGLAFLASGCSEGAASQDANAPIRIETSQMYVTVRNQTGLALNEVEIVITPVGRSTVYKKFLGRLESAENRNVMLGDFMGRDGTPFSLRIAKPRSVQVLGTDVNGKKYDVQVAWQ